MNLEEKYFILLLTIDLGAAFEMLVPHYAPQLCQYALRLTRNKEEAEDKVQEAFERAYAALGRYSLERKKALHLKAFLYSIVRNLCYNSIRDKGQEIVGYFPETDYDEFEIATQELPEYITEQKEREEEFTALISQLQSPYREILSLYLEEYSYKEIADRLNIPIGTVKSYLSRGKEKFRWLLAIQRDEVQ